MAQVILEYAMVVLLAGVISITAVLLWARLAPDPDQVARTALRNADQQVIFLFDEEDLVDCTAPARRIMNDLATGGSDLCRLLRGQARRFPGLPSLEKIKGGAFEGTVRGQARDHDLRMRIDQWDGFIRVTLVHHGDVDEGIQSDDAYTQMRHGDELAILRTVTDEAPLLLWQTNSAGEIEWANETYLTVVDAVGEADRMTWPPTALFPELHSAPPTAGKTARAMIDASDTGASLISRSFDVHCVERGGRFNFFAFPADGLVKAEASQREFVQTLTKTFAQLSIGLAIFDKDRRMALFNPALLDMMRLPVEFLAQRPTLQAFLDRLRADSLLAEPKDYKAWRSQIVELEAQAQEGSYCETWNLPGGITFRVTGRPHPDGAIAFLFEDISAEVSLSHRFRSEIELGHEALDAIEEAILVVNGVGMVTLSNRAYRAMWQDDADEGLVVSRLRDAADRWRACGGDRPTWDALVDAIERRNGATTWSGQITTDDGRRIACRTQRISGGSTLVGFSTLGKSRPVSSKREVVTAC
ncbi:MAG: PAS-domain containing protein [Pseudomonadota bacterium]